MRGLADLNAINFSKNEDINLAHWLRRKDKAIEWMAMVLKREPWEVKAHIKAKAYLRILARTPADDEEHRLRAKMAWEIEDHR